MLLRPLHCHRRVSNALKFTHLWSACRQSQVRRYASPASSSPDAQAASSRERSTFYVTTPIFYPNAAPHIGHLYTLVTADIIARHARLAEPDRPVFFLTGTDEHGLKIQRAAETRGMDPLSFCNEISETFRELARVANISYSRFIRTTDEDHRKAVQRLWRDLDNKGFIWKDVYKGYYSVTDECFYTREQVELRDGRYYALETGSVTELSEEENYMFSMSKLGERLGSFYLSEGHDSVVPDSHAFDVTTEVHLGLGDLSVSRPRSRLEWGIPVPDDCDHTIYVWVDALTNYLTATGYPWTETGKEDLARFWPPDVQVVGKDIVRFHAIYFPAMLKALGIQGAKKILVHPHWTVDRKKMSKSVGNVVDPFAVIHELGVDVVRFYLARVGGSYSSDHGTYWSDVQLQKHSGELRSLLGNLYSRTHSTAVMRRLEDYRGIREVTLDAISVDGPTCPWTFEVMNGLESLGSQVGEDLSDFKIKDALDRIVHQLNLVNRMLENVRPWDAATTTGDRAKAIALSSEALRICGVVLQPFIPGKAAELLDGLGVPADEREWRHSGWLAGSVGEYVSSMVLFPKVQKK
ncbi:tRNA synthetases class I (M)-domain-containing protein [Vararia minispora EC-137]|uniref:tRNA synthetases class I (M)-domain-containing protein n=1 Tax=Vararia minispora EC-137 TaxID=1314806 RepID=A0ACB8QHB5_9AGAM|nr:tRNA synthetases class I (M)-domain-containing protein [Vararia minispora EC-137]